MPFEKGEISNPEGRNGKQFQRALKMELAAAGEDLKELREIARNLIRQSKKDELGALPAINSVADRLDGKPAQEHQHAGQGGGAIQHSLTINFVKPTRSE